MFNKIKEKKGGFTLVELIIVLVILAVLAAFLVPTLTGYIKEADKKAVVSEARLAVMAAQTKANELYAIDRGVTDDEINDKISEIKVLAEVEGTITDDSIKITSDAKIGDLEYISKDSKWKCTYDADGTEKYAVVPNS